MVPCDPTSWYSCPCIILSPWVWTGLSASSKQSGAEVMEHHFQDEMLQKDCGFHRDLSHSLLDHSLWGKTTARLWGHPAQGPTWPAAICVSELGSRSQVHTPRPHPSDETVAWANGLTITSRKALSQRCPSKRCPDSYSWKGEIVSICCFKSPSFRVIY